MTMTAPARIERPPLRPCSRCKHLAGEIVLARGPWVSQQRTAHATELAMHRYLEPCPNRDTGVMGLPTHVGDVYSCTNCVLLRILLSRATSDRRRRSILKGLDHHQAHENCPARIPAEAAIA